MLGDGTVESERDAWLVEECETVIPGGIPVWVEGLGELEGEFCVWGGENVAGGEGEDGNLEDENEKGGECGRECG